MAMPTRPEKTCQHLARAFELWPVAIPGMGTPPNLGATNLGSMNHDLARQFGWEIAAINVHLQDIRNFGQE